MTSSPEIPGTRELDGELPRWGLSTVAWRLLLKKRALHAAIYTSWLRLLGIRIGRRTTIDPSVYISHPNRIVMDSDCKVRYGAVLIGRSKHPVGIQMGKGVHVHQYAYLDAYGGQIILGEGVRIGHFSVVAGHGGVTFGSYSGVGGHSYVIAANHRFRDVSVPHVLQEESRKGIKIGSNVWGASGVIILDGVTIGNNCVIGAGSVVRRDVPDNAVVIGNPARVAYIFGAPDPMSSR